MSFLLDTDTCSAHLKGERLVFSKFVQHSGRLHVSAITAGELYSWVLRAKAPPDRLQLVQRFLMGVTLLPVDYTDVLIYRRNCRKNAVGQYAGWHSKGGAHRGFGGRRFAPSALLQLVEYCTPRLYQTAGGSLRRRYRELIVLASNAPSTLHSRP